MGIFRKAFGLETLAADAPAGEYSADVIPPARSTSAALGVDRALSLVSVFRAVQIIAGMGSQLTLNSWRGTQLVTPAPALVAQPDPWRPLTSFLERFLVNAATDGNNFLVTTRAPGSTAALTAECLDPFRTRIRWENGVKLFDAYDLRTGRPRTYTTAEVLHVPALEVPGHDRGLGPIGACRATLAGHLDVRDYAAGWFGKDEDDIPSGVLTTDQRLDPEAARQYKRAWLYPEDLDRDGNPVRHRGPSVRVLGSGLSYAPVQLKPSDAQWLEAQSFGVLDVARLFGLPADYLLAAVDGSSLTYANLEMIDAQFLRTTLFPVYLRKLEAALTTLLPNGQVARFDASELLRPDAKTRAEIDAVYIAQGVYDAAHVRNRERIPGAAPRPAPAPQEDPAR